MSFIEFHTLLLFIAVIAWGTTDAVRRSGISLSQFARRAMGSAAALILIFIACLNMSNVVPMFATVATKYLMIRPDAEAQGKVFAAANLGQAALAGAMGVIGLLLALTYKKPD